MNLKDICTDLEISKELKEHGFPQDTIFIYGKNWEINNKSMGCIEKECATPTAEEILKELPVVIWAQKFNETKYSIGNRYIRIDEGNNDMLRIGYWLLMAREPCLSFEDIKSANFLAKMWIYLKENNLLEVKE